MPATLSQTITTKDGVKIDPKDIKVTSSVLWKCDSGRCQSRHGQVTELTWNEEEATASIDNLPAGFFKLIKIMPNPLNQEEAYGFCSVTCARDWLMYDYQVPKSGKQILAEKKTAAQMVLPFPEPPLNPITAESDATGFVENCGAAQDTGDPWSTSEQGAAQ